MIFGSVPSIIGREIKEMITRVIATLRSEFRRNDTLRRISSAKRA